MRNATCPARALARTLATLVTTLLIVAGCSSPQTAAPGGARIGTLNIRLESDWPHIDVSGRTPGGGIPSGQITTALYDSLVFIGPDSQDPSKPKLLPYLASSWDQTPTSITFHMRTDATCPDGTPVTPSLVKQTAELRMGAAGIGSIWGKGPFTATADEAAHTFTMTFGTPFSDAIYGFLPYNGLAIICPAGLANPDMLQQQAAGSGPYTLVEAVHGDHLTLKRRDDWSWGPNGITAKDLPESIVFKVVTNETTAANLLLTGGLDLGRVGGQDQNRLLEDKSLISKTTTSFYNYPLIFNQSPSEPTSDPKVREALVSAIDVNQWNQAANQGRGEISPSFLMPKADCFDPATKDLAVKDPSPEKSKQVLLAAGYTAGADGKLEKNGKPLTIVLVSNTLTGIGNGGEYLASQWEKAGITVDTRVTDFNTFLQRLNTSDFDALTTVYPFDQPNPNRAINTYTGQPAPSGSNATKGVDPLVEEAIRAAAASVGAERCNQWGIVQRQLVKTFAIMPLASPQIVWFSRGVNFFPGASWSDVRFLRPAGS